MLSSRVFGLMTKIPVDRACHFPNIRCGGSLNCEPLVTNLCNPVNTFHFKDFQ